MDIEWDVMGYALEEFFAWQREIRESPFVFFFKCRLQWENDPSWNGDGDLINIFKQLFHQPHWKFSMGVSL